MWPIEVSLDRPIGREMEMWAEGKVRCGLRGWGRALRQAWPRKVPPRSLLEEPEVAWGEGPGTCFPSLEVVCPSQRADFRKRVGVKFWINMGWTSLHVKVIIIGMVCRVKLWDLFILRFQSRWMIVWWEGVLDELPIWVENLMVSEVLHNVNCLWPLWRIV